MVQRQPVGARQGGAGAGGDHTLRMPVQVKHLQVLRPEFVAHIRHGRFGAQGRREAVGQVTGHRHRVLHGKWPLGYAQHVKFERHRVAGLVLVDAVQIGHQRLVRRTLPVELLHICISMGTNAHGAEQAVDIKQFRTQNLGQLATRQAACHFHLEQAVLRVHITQCPVHVGLVAGPDMRHTAFVITHLDRGLQPGKCQRSAALGLLGMYEPGGSQRRNQQQARQHCACCLEDSCHSLNVCATVLGGQTLTRPGLAGPAAASYLRGIG